MRVNGKWLPCDDGVVRPLIGDLVHLADGREIEVAFLLDAGADRTVFSPDFPVIPAEADGGFYCDGIYLPAHSRQPH